MTGEVAKHAESNATKARSALVMRSLTVHDTLSPLWRQKPHLLAGIGLALISRCGYPTVGLCM